MTHVIPAALQERLDSGATTLCRCWRLDRPDGVSLGFTDHDEPIAFDGLSFEPAAGVSGSGLESAEGLAVDNQEITGALRSDSLNEVDLKAGLFDGAVLRNWLVDWTEPSLRALLFKGSLGAVRRRGGAFSAEVLGLAEALNRPVGRQLLPTCDAALGDARCGVDLASAQFRRDGVTAEAGDGRRFAVEGLDTVAPGWFSRGRLTWSAGANAGAVSPVKAHFRQSGRDLVELWSAPPRPVAAGDAFAITAGCDKRLATCRDKFANLPNFRGFPHIPGDDWITGYPGKGERNDGGSLLGA